MNAAGNIRATLAPLRDQLSAALGPLVAQVRSNRRLALGLALIPLILWGYLVLLSQGWVDDSASQLRQSQEELARIERVAGDASWARRAKEVDIRRNELEARLWRIETEGLARAEFQEWLLSAARTAGIGRPQVRLESNSGDGQRAGGYRSLNASLSGDFAPESLTAFLTTIANEKRLIVVSSMRIQRQPLPRIDMVLTAFGAAATTAPEAAK